MSGCSAKTILGQAGMNCAQGGNTMLTSFHCLLTDRTDECHKCTRHTFIHNSANLARSRILHRDWPGGQVRLTLIGRLCSLREGRQRLILSPRVQRWFRSFPRYSFSVRETKKRKCKNEKRQGGAGSRKSFARCDGLIQQGNGQIISSPVHLLLKQAASALETQTQPKLHLNIRTSVSPKCPSKYSLLNFAAILQQGCR